MRHLRSLIAVTSLSLLLGAALAQPPPPEASVRPGEPRQPEPSRPQAPPAVVQPPARPPAPSAPTPAPPPAAPSPRQVQVTPAPSTTPAPEAEDSSRGHRAISPPASVLQPPRRGGVIIERPVPVVPVIPPQPSQIIVTPPPVFVPPPQVVPLPTPGPGPVPIPSPSSPVVVINSFPNGGFVPEDDYSTFFPTDSWRPVETIEITWTDHGANARGQLYVNGESSPRWDSRSVDSPGTVVFPVNDIISGFAIRATRDDLWLLQIVVHYARVASASPYEEYDFTNRPLQISEDHTSSVFNVDPSRLISQIQVSWGDRDRQRARGRVLIEDSRTRALSRQSVRGEGEVVTWDVNDYAQGFRIEASRDDLYLFWIRVFYADAGRVIPGAITGPVCIYGPTAGAPIYVPEGTYSQMFIPPDTARPVRAIRIVWDDRGRNAWGYLLVNGEPDSRFRPEEVSSPGEIRWIVGEPVQAFRLYADNDSIWLREIWVEY
jgi:hypothetical protein